jgi:serine/threonine protein kinase
VFGEELIFLIMEYCPRGDLFDYVTSLHHLEDAQARTMFAQMASALRYVHSRDIAHRDLKLENVLLDADLNIRLADFGLCHEISHKSLLKTPCGSPSYAPPEILQNVEYDGKMSDIWSLGVILFVMVSGSLPWSDSNQFEMSRQIDKCEIKFPDFVSAPVRILLTRMLSKDPAGRPTIDGVMESAWLNSERGFSRGSTCCPPLKIATPINSGSVRPALVRKPFLMRSGRIHPMSVEPLWTKPRETPVTDSVGGLIRRIPPTNRRVSNQLMDAN